MTGKSVDSTTRQCVANTQTATGDGALVVAREYDIQRTHSATIEVLDYMYSEFRKGRTDKRTNQIVARVGVSNKFVKILADRGYLIILNERTRKPQEEYVFTLHSRYRPGLPE